MHKYYITSLFCSSSEMCKILPVYYYASCAFEDRSMVWEKHNHEKNEALMALNIQECFIYPHLIIMHNDKCLMSSGATCLYSV